MFPFILLGLGVVGLIAFTGSKSQAQIAIPNPAVLLALYLSAVKSIKQGDPAVAREKTLNAATVADQLGLPMTGQALREKLPLPIAENWPGTDVTVRAYIALRRKEAFTTPSPMQPKG